ncbi:hypothetical protein MTP99_006029 [Tenebrio molitor]|nr:hypothetical protein MTP99_006029 [Tenebrio molitor]
MSEFDLRSRSSVKCVEMQFGDLEIPVVPHVPAASAAPVDRRRACIDRAPIDGRSLSIAVDTLDGSDGRRSSRACEKIVFAPSPRSDNLNSSVGNAPRNKSSCVLCDVTV